LVSWILFAIAAALFVVVAVLYVRDRRDAKPIPTPPQVAGRNEMINVKQALEAQGLSVKFAPGGARSDALSEAGQVLDINGATAYVFVYTSVGAREADTNSLDLSAQPLLDVRGTPIVGGPPKTFTGSNILLLLFGGDDSIAAKVDAAIKGLP
jgi:hypothetical protein